jgi:hypothetical protein
MVEQKNTGMTTSLGPILDPVKLIAALNVGDLSYRNSWYNIECKYATVVVGS